MSALGSGRACLMAAIASAQRANVRHFHSTMFEQTFIPQSCFGYPYWQFGLYRVMRTSWSGVTPLLCCCRWPHSATQGPVLTGS